MSDTPEKKSHPWAWALSLAVVVLLLYVLSFPWIGFWIVERTSISPESGAYDIYCTPHVWMMRTPLQIPLMTYEDWCEDVSGRSAARARDLENEQKDVR